MAPRLALGALGALLLTAANVQAATSPFWTYTSRLMQSVSASPYTRYNSAVTTYYETDLRTIKPTVTPTATPTSVSTSTNRYDEDLQIVYAYYPTGAVAESDLVPTYDYSATTTSTTTTTYLYISMPVVMTAPASCPTPFTVTTTASVSVPSQVTNQLKPTSTKAGTSTSTYRNYVYETATWWLSAGAAPFSTESNFYYSYYIASCSTPPSAFSTGSPRSGGDDDDNSSSSRFCYSYYCGTPLKIWIIIIASLIPSLFLLGFLESWFWFRRLMLGKSAMRFGTVSWICISLWVLCFTRMQDKRSPEDQKLLAEKWKAMGSGAAFKAWWKWGFRHRYPEELLGQYSRTTVGIVPTGQPLHTPMTHTGPGFQPGPPGAPGTGALQPVPGQPGQVFYYGPPPPGWVPGPNGTLMPPQGYVYPPPQQPGYYGEMPKDGSIVSSSSPVSALAHNHNQNQPGVSPITTPQPTHAIPGATEVPAQSLPPQHPVPSPPPQLPPMNISEAPSDAPRPTPPPPSHPTNPPPPKNDPHDRSLYE